jgi:hypothetical protein
MPRFYDKRAAAAARAKEKLKKIQATGKGDNCDHSKEEITKDKGFFSSFLRPIRRAVIVGGVADKATGAAILFESKREGENLTSRNQGPSRQDVESSMSRRSARSFTDPLTRELSFEPVPVLAHQWRPISGDAGAHRGLHAQLRNFTRGRTAPPASTIHGGLCAG